MMAVYTSAASSADLVEGVGGCPESDGYGADDREDVAVAAFGGGFPFVGVGDISVDLADEVFGVAFVDPVEGTHDLRVSPMSLLAMLRDVWAGLTGDHRLLFSSAVPVGCLLFLVLGAVTR